MRDFFFLSQYKGIHKCHRRLLSILVYVGVSWLEHTDSKTNNLYNALS